MTKDAIQTDAVFSGFVRIRILYDPQWITGEETALRVFRSSNAKSPSVIWEDCTLNQDLASHWLWAETNDLSTFVVAEPDCMCLCHGDPACDGIANVLDVVTAVNIAFKNAPTVSDADCPNDLTDVNCDGATNVIDVVKLVNVTFRNADQQAEYCDPCSQ